MILYFVVHKENSKLYVGWSSLDLEKRREAHLRNVRCGSQYRFHRALRKDGVDAFEWWVGETHDTADEAKQSEIYWIAYLRSQGAELYNGTDGGDGFYGGRHTLETRQRMTRERTGRKLKTVYRGEEAGNSKLTQQQVDEIRASNLSHRALSKMYGVVPSQICHIKKGKRWT